MVWRSFNVKRFANKNQHICALITFSMLLLLLLLFATATPSVCVILSKQQNIGFIFRSGWSPFAIWAHWRRQFILKCDVTFSNFPLFVEWTRERDIRNIWFAWRNTNSILSVFDFSTRTEGDFIQYSMDQHVSQEKQTSWRFSDFDSSCILLCILMVYIGAECFWRILSYVWIKELI